MICFFYTRLLFCFHSYGALLGGPLGRRRTAINNYAIGNCVNRVHIIDSLKRFILVIVSFCVTLSLV